MSRPDVPRSLSTERLAAALTEVGGSARPDYLDDIVTRAARTRQRPAWTFLERWLPMSMLATAPPLAPVRPLPRMTARVALTLSTLALVTGALVGSALLATSPDPLPVEGVRNGLIAFDSEGDIWVVKPDGTGIRRLTENADDETSPVWSPDGTQLAVWTGADGATVVRVLNADGSIERTIAPPDGTTFPSPGSVGCAGTAAAWSPDGRTLAAPVLDASYRDSLVLLDVATGDGGILDVGMPVCSFAWSPVGSLLAFHGGLPGAQSLYVVDADGSDVRLLSPEGQKASLLDFAPDGTWILAALEDDGVVKVALDGTIEVAPADVESVATPNHSFAPDDTVSVAPDGRSVAFLRGGVPGTWDPRELWVGTLDGSDKPRLVASEVSGPGGWSPDGALLAAWTPQWDEILILDPFGDATPIRVPSPGNMGILSWQALR
jgi:TolB protein